MALHDPVFVFSSIRYDLQLASTPSNTLTVPPSAPSPYLLLPYHRDRLVTAAHVFAWESAAASLEGPVGLDRLRRELDTAVRAWEEDPTNAVGTPLKIRISLNPQGALTIDLSPTPPIPSSALFNTSHTPTSLALSHPNPIPVHLDSLPTPISPFTRYKTSSRAHYLAARLRAGLGETYAIPGEVVLWNPEGEVMECSISNVAFWRGGRWVTPDAASGGLGGVVRRWMWERGAYVEGKVRKSEVESGEWVLLSSGVRGVFVGKVVL